MAQQLCRPWDPPTQNDTTARVPRRALAQTLAQSPGVGLIELTGHWANCDVVVDVPDSWLDLTARFVRTLGGIDTVLETKRFDAIANPIVSGGRVGGVLFSVRGRPGDRFRVEVWATAEDHDVGKIYAIAWGDGDGYGDHASRESVDLYNATPDKARTFTSGIGGLAAGATTIFTANPLPSTRVAITELVWTRAIDGFGPTTLQLEESDGTIRAAWTTNAEAGTAGNGAVVREQWVAPPLWSAPGNGWVVRIPGGAPASSVLNVNGFNE